MLVPPTSFPHTTHAVPAARVPRRVWHAWLCTGVALATLAACSHTTPEAARPALHVAVPTQWASSTPAASTPETTTSAEAVAPSLAHWWQQLGDATLVALVEQALRANTSILSAQAAVDAARAQVDVQKAGLLPSLSASAGARRSKQGFADAGNSYNAGLDASWELDLWGKRRNAVRAGQESWAAAQASLYAAHVSLSAEVALQYIQLRSLQERLRIAQENLRLQAGTEEMTRWRVQAGLAASLDSEQARQSLAQTAAQIPSLQTSIAQSQHALAVLTGQTPAALFETLAPAAAVPQAPAGLAVLLPADTLRQRPDVQAQEHKLQAALANLSAQERANFPSLRLSGSLGVSALTVGALTNGASVARSIAAALAAPIFDAGANRAQIAGQKAQVEQARQAYRASVLAALQEVEDALVQLSGDQTRLTHIAEAAAAAANAQLLAQQRYDSGLVDFRTVLESERSLLSSQDSLAQAQAAISTDYVRLFKALGGGWQAQALDTPPNTAADPAAGADHADRSADVAPQS